MLYYIKPYLARAIAGIGIKALGTVTDLGLPLLLAYMIDTQLLQSDFSGIIQTGILMLVLSVVGLITNIYANYSAAVVSQRFARDLRFALFSRSTDFSLPEADRFGIPSLINRINSDVNHVQNMVLMMLRIVIRAPILLIGGIGMAFFLDPELSGVLILTMPVLALVVWLGMRKIVPIYQRLQRAVDRMILVMRENLQGLKVVRALSTGEMEGERFQDAAADVRAEELHSGRILAVINPGMALVMNLGLVATVWFGGVRVSYGAMQTGEIVAFVNYFLMILNALLVITRILIAYTKSVVSTQRIDEILSKTPSSQTEEVPLATSLSQVDLPVTADPSTQWNNASIGSILEPHTEKKELLSPNGTEIISDVLLSFEHVSFTYPGSVREVLHDVSFQVRKGQTFAIIGSTGSGKTSILNLILGLYPASSGVIHFDGETVDLGNVRKLREKIRVVFQNPDLFSQTIEENLRWSKPDATETEVGLALETAQASEFVRHFKDGVQHALSQGGRNLSGGQRQRLAIARALLGKSPLLVFDDSTSALDALTEKKLQHALSVWGGNKQTLLIIAQKISSIKDADQIMVLDGKGVESIGTHVELSKHSVIYREIMESQGGGLV